LKNPTPRRLSLYAALISSLVVLAATYFTGLHESGKRETLPLLLIFSIAFFSTFVTFNYLLRIFIYRKIKPIYKAISRLKSGNSKAGKVDIDRDIISEVNNEVMRWETERDEEIAQLKKLETFRREFLGNVSHELKTPIFNIQGYIHTLLDGGLDDKDVNVHYLQRAAKSVDRLCLIVEDLEAISKLESGELELEFRAFDIHELIGEVFESLELPSRERNITLGFKEGCDKPFYIFADKERIRQVVVNLVVNSIKYGKEGGKTVVGIYDFDEKYLIEVTDTGIGIDTIHLPRLFERFYRVDKSRSREQGGTGLGLAIVKHLIEAHGETINVRSAIGVGSTFGFTLRKAK
jgi:two-component system phosphate regulon sensor histidine kinase PhoR